MQRCSAKAKVIGPGTTEFEHRFDCDESKSIMDFIYELSQPPYNTRLQAISWHELGSMPSTVPTHADALRKFMADPRYFTPPYEAELHVNEYTQPDNSEIPGWIIGWLYYAEEANLDYFTRACWWMSEGRWPFIKEWCNCRYGLNGLLMRDMQTAQQPYYAYWAYSMINDSTRLAATSTNSDVNALAGKSDENNTIRILTGLYNRPPTSSLEVIIAEYPYDATVANVSVFRVPNINILDRRQNPKAQPGTGFIPTYSGPAAVSGGIVKVEIDPYANGDMYFIEVSAPS